MKITLAGLVIFVLMIPASALAIAPRVNEISALGAVRDSLGVLQQLVYARPDSFVVKSSLAATESLTIGATPDTLRVKKGKAANITNMSSTIWQNLKIWQNNGATDTVRFVIPPLTYRRFEFADLDSFTIPVAGLVLRSAEAKK